MSPNVVDGKNLKSDTLYDDPGLRSLHNPRVSSDVPWHCHLLPDDRHRPVVGGNSCLLHWFVPDFIHFALILFVVNSLFFDSQPRLNFETCR